MVGAGVRVLSQNTSLFEKIMNTIHQKAPPSSKICFNTNPADTVEAILRWANREKGEQTIDSTFLNGKSSFSVIQSIVL